VRSSSSLEQQRGDEHEDEEADYNPRDAAPEPGHANLRRVALSRASHRPLALTLDSSAPQITGSFMLSHLLIGCPQGGVRDNAVISGRRPIPSAARLHRWLDQGHA
jgi:hypothetical protein